MDPLKRSVRPHTRVKPGRLDRHLWKKDRSFFKYYDYANRSYLLVAHVVPNESIYKWERINGDGDVGFLDGFMRDGDRLSRLETSEF